MPDPTPGTRVHVFSADQKQDLGFGVIEAWEKLGGNYKTPRILLDDETTIRGYECWWHPVESKE